MSSLHEYITSSRYNFRVVTGPHTGYLSPEGVLYGCMPWQHEALACAIGRGLDLRVDGMTTMGEQVRRHGWVKIANTSAAIRNPTNQLCTEGRLNELQHRIVKEWIEAGVQLSIPEED